MSDMEVDDDFDAKSQGFLEWLRQNGTTISSKIEIADLRSKDAGRGVIAKQDIEEDVELFSIPRSSVLTVETSRLPAEIKDKVNDPWLSLILVMVYEHQLGAKSSWRPYFDVLPSDFDTLMFWDDHELAHLQGSAVLNKIGKASANQAFQEQFIPLIKQNTSTFHAMSLSDEELLALCHRMGSTIMAYAFDLEKPSANESSNEEDGWEEDEEETEMLPKGMVPLADMLNADADRNNAKLYYEDDKVVMKSTVPIKAGEEIFNDYGPLPTADVLRRYGYTTHNYAKYDVVEVSTESIRATVKEQQGIEEEEQERRLQYLDEQGVLDDAYDISRPSDINDEAQQFPDELCVLLNTLVLTKIEYEKLEKKEKLPKPTLSPSAASVLKTVIEKQQAMYIDDMSLIGAVHGAEVGPPDAPKRSARRLRMAYGVVFGEKTVLKEALQTLEEMGRSDEAAAGGKRKAEDQDPARSGDQSKKQKSR